ncbi:MAG: LytTR family transcriptional regulator DNA-binding domain-containing protein [Bacteroidales bacterium]|nr:LytTR family transcriptional regulator DNA-binding domain-containing protein [Bacteroidales bacterium]
MNTRDEVTILDTNRIMYFQADGNYTRFRFADGRETMASYSLSKMEAILASATSKVKTVTYYRLGRSLIINQSYLFHVNTLKQKLVLAGENGYVCQLDVPKATLKAYKDFLIEEMKKGQSQ